MKIIFCLKITFYLLLIIFLNGCASFKKNVDFYSGLQTIILCKVHQDEQEDQFKIIFKWIYMNDFRYDENGNYYEYYFSPQKVIQDIIWIQPEQLINELTNYENSNVLMSTLKYNLYHLGSENFFITKTNDYIKTSLFEVNQLDFLNPKIQINKNNLEIWGEGMDSTIFYLKDKLYMIPHVTVPLKNEIWDISTIIITPVVYEGTNLYISGWISLKNYQGVDLNAPISSTIKFNEWMIIADQRKLSIKTTSTIDMLFHKSVFFAKLFYEKNGRWPKNREELNTIINTELLPKNVTIKLNHFMQNENQLNSKIITQCLIKISEKKFWGRYEIEQALDNEFGHLGVNF